MSLVLLDSLVEVYYMAETDELWLVESNAHAAVYSDDGVAWGFKAPVTPVLEFIGYFDKIETYTHEYVWRNLDGELHA